MLSTACCKFFSTISYNVILPPVNNCCQQPLFTVNSHCSIIVDNHEQACFINCCRLLFRQHCNNYCSLSTANNYWSNNTHQHRQFHKCCWTLITILFSRCSATWSILRVKTKDSQYRASLLCVSHLKISGICQNSISKAFLLLARQLRYRCFRIFHRELYKIVTTIVLCQHRTTIDRTIPINIVNSIVVAPW